MLLWLFTLIGYSLLFVPLLYSSLFVIQHDLNKRKRNYVSTPILNFLIQNLSRSCLMLSSASLLLELTFSLSAPTNSSFMLSPELSLHSSFTPIPPFPFLLLFSLFLSLTLPLCSCFLPVSVSLLISVSLSVFPFPYLFLCVSPSLPPSSSTSCERSWTDHDVFGPNFVRPHTSFATIH